MTAPAGPRIGSLCSGYGGLDLAVLQVLGGAVAWHAEHEPPTERNPHPSQAGARLLAHRWPGVPNHGDITAIDWTTVEPVDVLTAGYPCQPDSAAGKRLGVADERWIWPAVRDAIRYLGPSLVVLENVRGHLGRGFPGVLGDLASIGLRRAVVLRTCFRRGRPAPPGAAVRPRPPCRLRWPGTGTTTDQPASRGVAGMGRCWTRRSCTCCRRPGRRMARRADRTSGAVLAT